MSVIYDANGNPIDVGGASDALIQPTKAIASNTANYHQMWDEMAALDFCTKTQIATVQNLPIYKYVFSIDPKTMASDYSEITDGSFYVKPKISIISGIHGDERATPLFLYEFMSKVCANPSYRKYLGAYDFHVIPLCNPTGYDSNKRTNYQGININRDATTSPQTVEAQALKAHFDGNNWAACFDLHMSIDTGEDHSAFANMQNTATDDNQKRLGKLWTTASFENEKLLEIKYNKPHKQTHFYWQPFIGDTWVNYPGDVAETTDISITIEIGRIFPYYSNTSTQFNPTALEAGNTIIDKYIRAVLDNL